MVDFPPLKEKVHVQQFLGCTNWLRWFLFAEYAQAAKVLGAYQKDGAVFPPGGLGAEDPPVLEANKAYAAIKLMVKNHIVKVLPLKSNQRNQGHHLYLYLGSYSRS